VDYVGRDCNKHKHTVMFSTDYFSRYKETKNNGSR